MRYGPTQAGVYPSGYKYGALAQLLDDELTANQNGAPALPAWLTNNWLAVTLLGGVLVWYLSRKDREHGLVANPKVKLSYRRVPQEMTLGGEKWVRGGTRELYEVTTSRGTELGTVVRKPDGWFYMVHGVGVMDVLHGARGLQGPFGSRKEAATALYHEAATPAENPKVRLTYEKIPNALANFPQLQATEAYIVITPKGTMLGVVWRTRNGMWRNQRFLGGRADPRLPGRGQSWDIRGPFDSRVEAASDLYHRVAEPEHRIEYAPKEVKAVYKAMLKSATDFYVERYEKTGPVAADYGDFAIYVGRWSDGSWILGDNFDKVMESLLYTPDGRWWLRTYGEGRDLLSFAEAKREASAYFQDHADELEEW